MLTRWLLRNGAFCVLFAMLFAQAATAANACLRPLSAPPAADAQLSAHCEAQRQSSMNLCLYHCADQTDHNGAQLHAVAPAPPAVMLVLPPPATTQPRQNPLAHSPPTTDPPIPIRNCCFRI